MIYYRYIPMLVLFYGALLPAPVRAQAACNDDTLAEANRRYELDFWHQAIDLVEPCLPKKFETNLQRVQAHRLVALAYYELGDLDASELWIKRMMRIDGRYAVDPDDPQFFRDNVEDLRPKKWYQKRWLRLGIPTIAAGVASYFVFRPQDESPVLPLPQPLPLPPTVPPPLPGPNN